MPDHAAPTAGLRAPARSREPGIFQAPIRVAESVLWQLDSDSAASLDGFMTSTSTPGALRDWELGDLREITPSLVVRDEDDDVGRFILRLAVAFNDLKGMILFDQYRLAFTRPEPNEVTAHAGQWAGLITQIHRFLAGILNEALMAIHDELPAIGSVEVTRLLASLPTGVQELWRDIIEEARSSPAAVNRTNRAMLARLRNKSSFHYDGKNLRHAFLQYFAGVPTEKNAKAYYSAGPDLDGTRYYFADAAAQQDYLNAGIERGKKTDTEVFDFARKVNNAFALLINAFLTSRESASGTRAAPQPDSSGSD